MLSNTSTRGFRSNSEISPCECLQAAPLGINVHQNGHHPALGKVVLQEGDQHPHGMFPRKGLRIFRQVGRGLDLLNDLRSVSMTPKGVFQGREERLMFASP